MCSAKTRGFIFQALNFPVVLSAIQEAQCPASCVQEVRETPLIPKASAVWSQTNSNETQNLGTPAHQLPPEDDNQIQLQGLGNRINCHVQFLVGI